MNAKDKKAITEYFQDPSLPPSVAAVEAFSRLGKKTVIIDNEFLERYVRGEVCLPRHGRVRRVKCFGRRCLNNLIAFISNKSS